MQRILILLFFVLSFWSKAQIQSKLYLDGLLYNELQFRDSLALMNYIQELQIDWIDGGYYFSGIDSLQQVNSMTSVYLHKGEKLKLKLPSYKGRRIRNYIFKRLNSYTNKGFPFATVMLDSVYQSDEYLDGKLVIEQGPEIRYDSAYFFNELKTNHRYIYQLLDIMPGELFSEKNNELIFQKIKRSTFLQPGRPTDLSFKNNKAKTFLDIKEEASSTFQGVVGLQQVQSGQTVVVGSLALDIQNLFRSGKQFKFEWERFAEQSQSLSIAYKHPFLLDSKISPAFSFDLLKQDTTFLSRITELGIHTYVAPQVELFLGYEATNGTLLTTSLDVIQNSGLADFRRRIYSVGLTSGLSNSLEKYSAGITWNVSASAGRKEIQRNLSLPDSYYDSILIETNFYRFELGLSYQIKLLKRQTFFHSIESGIIKNDEVLSNELYRIGGLNSLRGFNEKEFFAKKYVLSRSEFRSFFEDRSYAYVFFDQLLFERNSQREYPFGLGLGFALATSAGQFSFALAGGKSAEQDFSFSTMKAHFGYISRF